MNILGISGGVRHGAQDGAAALVRDGAIISAIEEERLSGDKHAIGMLPELSIRACLSVGAMSIRDIDCVATHGETYPNYKDTLERWFQLHFGYCPPIRIYNHHLAHCASAYYASGFKDALVMSADFSGDLVSTMLCHGTGRDLRVDRAIRKPNSLGIFYSLITQFLGFRRDADEYKVMSLAAFGEPIVDLSWLLDVRDETYQLNSSFIRNSRPGESSPSKQEPIYEPILTDILGRPRLSSDVMTADYKNIAASAQVRLEEAAIVLVRGLHRRTGSRSLCVAGGVGLNCVMNQRLLALPFIDRIFVQPAASDAGIALGAAYLAARDNGEPIRPLSTAYLGVSPTRESIISSLDNTGVNYSYVGDVTGFAVEALESHKLVALFQGADEYGPRALGNRSILANPSDGRTKDRINRRVKFRDEFQPFGPSILAEKAPAILGGYKHDLPYMTVTSDLPAHIRPNIPAVVHVDGSTRPQTVSTDAELYHRLIREFEEATGVPALLNTSFNGTGQPIVHDVKQAVATFYSCGLDVLLIPPFVVTKP